VLIFFVRIAEVVRILFTGVTALRDELVAVISVTHAIVAVGRFAICGSSFD
jgi:hypothetical protein